MVGIDGVQHGAHTTYPGWKRTCTTLRTVPFPTVIHGERPSVYPIVVHSHPERRSNSAHSFPPTVTPLRAGMSGMCPTHGKSLSRAPRTVNPPSVGAAEYTSMLRMDETHPGAEGSPLGERLLVSPTRPGGMVGVVTPPPSSPPRFTVRHIFSYVPNSHILALSD